MSDKSDKILELHNQGLSNYEIARKLETGTSYVSYVLNPNHPQRKLNLERAKRVVREKVRRIAKENEIEARSLILELQEEHG